ncbi:uncharacterized protein LOC124140535 isoform X4 [Haliotis rufescens]|uniref:uncharacterized protein LOC124140535 isoform X4 n=1 Tax=Haliotis rufescens TaxID=6454 RepID=UPI00201EFA1A|nr:uncharacterized protein LOC124140535 isoform X4 [Haliotis rufescens]
MTALEENDFEGSSDASDIDVDGICAGIKCIYSIESSDSDESLCDRNTTMNCQEAFGHQNVATGSHSSYCTHADDPYDAPKTTVDIRGGLYVYPANFEPQKSCPGIWKEVKGIFSPKSCESLIYFGVSLMATVGASLKSIRLDNIICDLIVFSPSRIPLVLTIVRDEMTKQDKVYNNLVTRTVTSIVREHSTPNFVASHGVLEERQSNLMERRLEEFEADAKMFAIPDSLYMDTKKYEAVIGSFLNSVGTFRFTEEVHHDQGKEVQLRRHSATNSNARAQSNRRQGTFISMTEHPDGGKAGKAESRREVESGYLTSDDLNEGCHGDARS